MKIAFAGKATAGKDTLKNMISENLGLLPEISYTTRPPRNGEINGKSYHFVSEDEFHKINLIEKVNFNGWWYGTGLEEFNKSQLFIFTPSGLAILPKEYRNQLTVFFLDINESEQRKRLELRNDTNDNNDRRIKADIEDFKNFKDYQYRLNTDLLSIEDSYHKILEFLNFR